MPLQKQLISMPIVDGIDTKGDDKTVLPTRFLELENVVFTSPGSFRKRFGYQALPNKDLENVRIATGQALSSFRSELLMYSNSKLYSFSENEAKWQDKGEIKFCNSETVQISADNSILENPAFFTYENITCYAFEKRKYAFTHTPSLGPDVYTEYKNIQIVIVDDSSNTILARHDIDYNTVSSVVTTDSFVAPKVGFAGSNFIVTFFADFTDARGGGVRYATIDYLNPTVFELQNDKIQTYANSSADLTMDICSFSNRCFFAYTNSSDDTEIIYISGDASLSNAVSLSTSDPLNNISLSSENGNLRVVVSLADGSQAIAYLFNFALSAPIHSPVNLSSLTTSPLDDLGAAGNAYTVTACQDPDDMDQSIVYIQLNDYTADLGLVIMSKIDRDGVETTTMNYMPGIEIQSKAITYGDSTYFFASKNIDPDNTSAGIELADSVPAALINKPVRTLYLIKVTQSLYEIVAQIEVDTNVFVNSSYHNGLPNCILSEDVITVPVAVITSLQPAGAARLIANSSIKKAVADFSQASNYFETSQGEALHISGGLLKMYDGYKVVEHGFLDTPDALKEINPTLSGSGGDLYASASLGVDAEKRYLYVVVYKWVDRTGKVHRSAPSPAVDLTTPSGTKFMVNLTFTPLYLTAKENVEIEIYRTTGDGTIFYKLSQVVDASVAAGTDDYITGSYPNDKTVKSISVLDSVTDVELQYAEPLYTTGGILENDAALSSYFVTNYKSRVFLILSDGYTLQYSKETGIGQPVRFNANFKIPLDDKGGKAIALAVMDDHLIIFKERAIFALTGNGPNELGQQDDYRAPYLVTADAGCIDPNSVVENPNGLMFKSQKGIYLLKRNFGLQYIGDSVEAYNSETILSATLLSSSNQIRLITQAGRALVYDYYSNRWSTFSNINGVDSIEFDGSYYFLKSDGLVMKETPGLYKDNGQFIRMKIRSAWIQIAGVQAFQRFYNLLLLGTFFSKHKLLVKFYFDFNPYASQETIIDTDSLEPSVYGGDDAFGDSAVFGGQFPLYQWQVFPKKQKCQSFQYELSDIKTEVDGESFSLSHVLAEIGVKQGAFKKETPRTAGVS